MKIRKLAAVLAVPLLMAAGTAMAEGPMPPAQGYGIGDRMPLFPGVGPVLGDGTGTAAPLGEALSKAGAVPVSEMGEVFLNHAALPKDVHYEPLARGDSVFARHMGTMTVKGKNILPAPWSWVPTLKERRPMTSSAVCSSPRATARRRGHGCLPSMWPS